LKNSTKLSKNGAKRLKIFEDFRVLRYPSQKNGTFTSLQLAQMIAPEMRGQKTQDTRPKTNLSTG
jgi:hypothetical protein